MDDPRGSCGARRIRSVHRSSLLNPHRGNCHRDHRLLAELIPIEFRNHLVLGYEILKWESDLPNPSLYQPISTVTIRQKTRLHGQCYLSQSGHDWFDDEAFLGLMRIRGVQCHVRYAEGFMVEKAVLGIRDIHSLG